MDPFDDRLYRDDDYEDYDPEWDWFLYSITPPEALQDLFDEVNEQGDTERLAA